MTPTRTTVNAADRDPRRRKKPIPGKGFRKSRRGCFNCKQRRVKCSEARPACRGCLRLGLDCYYPERAASLPSSEPLVSVNLDHLRFLHHFLTDAHPPEPHGAGTVWPHVAALSHEYEFLAYAVLGLAAQHLTLFCSQDYAVQALNLRVAAIDGLNKALSQPCSGAADADARYAAIMALTYQSAYMPDAMMEFFVLLRGWMFIQTKVVPDLEASVFRGFTRQAYIHSMQRHVQDRVRDSSVSALDDFLASLATIRPLCRGVAEVRYLAALERLGRMARRSPRQAFVDLVPCYALTNKMTEDEFRAFTEPGNGVARVLLAHFLMLNCVLEANFLGSSPRHFAFCKRISTSWVLDAAKSLPVMYQKQMVWPVGTAMGLRCVN